MATVLCQEWRTQESRLLGTVLSLEPAQAAAQQKRSATKRTKLGRCQASAVLRRLSRELCDNIARASDEAARTCHPVHS